MEVLTGAIAVSALMIGLVLFLGPTLFAPIHSAINDLKREHESHAQVTEELLREIRDLLAQR